MKKNIIVRSNREYNYFGNLLEDDYFASYSSTSTQKVLVLEYEYTSTITPSQLDADVNIYKSNSFLHLPNTFSIFLMLFCLLSDEINTLYQVQ